MSDVKQTGGMRRREFLRKAAVTGAAAAWSVPVINTVANTPAFGQSRGGTPKELSYVAIKYLCNGQMCFIKWDLDDLGNPDTGSFATPGCESALTANGSCGDAAHFNTPVVSADETRVEVCLSAAGIAAGCTLAGGVGVGKCGAPQNPQSGGECITPAPSGNCYVFDMCGA